MATVTNPFFSGQASGSVDSLTAFYNTTGGSIRTRVKGVKKRSHFRTFLSNAYFQRARYVWTNLSVSNRSEWQRLAKSLTQKNAFGNQYKKYPEILFYEACVSTLQYFGAPPISVPTSWNINYYPAFTLSREADGIDLSWDNEIERDYGIAVFSWRNLLSSQFQTKKRKLCYFFDGTFSSPQSICSAAGAVSDLDFMPYAVGGTYTFFWIKTVDRFGRQSTELHYQILNSP